MILLCYTLLIVLLLSFNLWFYHYDDNTLYKVSEINDLEASMLFLLVDLDRFSPRK